ncbi:MAG TPA: hypothetical protein VM345_17035 [Acidimicrobiales bacterium]|jgi:Flp pilus assembly protein TadG|nr:hypothetical protein [Acidimicrobiales bacterium]
MTCSRPLRGDGGSALMLVPAGVLVLIMLGAIAIDSTIVALAQRELSNRTAAVANDVAGATADDEAFYRSGEVTLDQHAAERRLATSFSPAAPAPFTAWGGRATTAGRSVTVEAWGDISYLFLKALPGFPDTTRVRATSTATARGG